MILAPGVPGVAFGTLADGDGRNDPVARAAIAAELGIASEWASVHQVHGPLIANVTLPGSQGEADGMVTRVDGLPLVIGTADCVPVALVGDESIAMLHAGWRGVALGIVSRALEGPLADTYSHAVLGPRIGPCCYEVDSDVVKAVGGFEATTNHGTTSVDLGEAIISQVADRVSVVDISFCTKCDDRFASHRRDGTKTRQVSLAWL